jgi:hypothetical protein
MPKLRLTYIFLDEGEFLYDSSTKKVYTFTAPHKLVGKIDDSFALVPKDDIVQA